MQLRLIRQVSRRPEATHELGERENELGQKNQDLNCEKKGKKEGQTGISTGLGKGWEGEKGDLGRYLN